MSSWGRVIYLQRRDYPTISKISKDHIPTSEYGRKCLHTFEEGKRRLITSQEVAGHQLTSKERRNLPLTFKGGKDNFLTSEDGRGTVLTERVGKRRDIIYDWRREELSAYKKKGGELLLTLGRGRCYLLQKKGTPFFIFLVRESHLLTPEEEMNISCMRKGEPCIMTEEEWDRLLSSEEVIKLQFYIWWREGFLLRKVDQLLTSKEKTDYLLTSEEGRDHVLTSEEGRGRLLTAEEGRNHLLTSERGRDQYLHPTMACGRKGRILLDLSRGARSVRASGGRISIQ